MTKVTGKYFGVEFSGKVAGFWGWGDQFGRDGEDSTFVELDSPIMVNGVLRKMICFKPQFGTMTEVA